MFFFINGIVRKEMYVNEHERLSKVRVMVFNTTFNNISVISWRQVLLLPQVTDKLYRVMCNVVSNTPHLNRIGTYNVSGDSD